MTLEPKSLSKAPLALMTLLTLAGTSSAQDYHARVRLHSDVFLPITGHRLEIRQGSNAWNLSTDAAGFTSYVEPVAGTAMEVILHPGPSTHGRLVGQRLVDQSGAPTSLDPRFDTYWYTQPLAVTTHFDSTTATTAAPLHDRWAFERAGSQSSYDFNARVACLALEYEVDGYFDYHRISPASDHSAGLLIQYGGDPARADLEDTLLYFDIEALNIGGSPDITTYHKPRTIADFGGSTLTATFVGMHGPYGLISLDGRLGRGDNLIMFSGTSNDSIGPLELYSSPTIDSVTSPGTGGSSSNGGGSGSGPCNNCDTSVAYDDPPTWNPNWPASPPASDGGCPDSVWIPGYTDVHTLTTIGAGGCSTGIGGPQGSEIEVEAGEKVKHSYKNKQCTVLSAAGLGAAGSFTNETTREYSFEHTTVTRFSQGFEPNPEDDCETETSLGCGECIQFYQYGFAAKQAYRRFWSFLHLSCFPEDLQFSSYGKGPVQPAKCSRETGMATNRTRVGDQAHCNPQ